MGSIVNPNNYPAKENVFTILVVALTWAMFGMYIPESSLFLLIGVFVLVLIGVSLFYRNPLDVIILTAVDGEFIVCPWHNFQYNVKDGKGPEGFNDFIPYYQILVENEFVWVTLA